MPISQTTILEAYGHLCDLADLGEKLAEIISQGDLLKGRNKRRQEIERIGLELALMAQRRQKLALELILRDEPGTRANPITGRLG